MFNINWCNLIGHSFKDTKVNRCFVAVEMTCKRCKCVATMEIDQSGSSPLYYWKYSDNSVDSEKIDLHKIG